MTSSPDQQAVLGSPSAGEKRSASRPAGDAPTDLELMRRIAERDRSALGALYDRYSRYVHATCLRVLANAPDAEDVTVQVFIELWERPRRFDPGRGELCTYLMILARSRATDLRRSRGRRRQLLANAAEQVASPTVDPVTPAESASLRERREHVQEALATLGTQQREAVELAFLNGMSHREIADYLKTPLGTVKTRIRLGLIQLRKSLRTLGRGEEP